MKIYYIDLPQEVTTFMERLYYEYNTIQDNISFMIQHYHDKDILENEAFIEYQNNEINLKKLLDKSLRKIEADYVPKAFEGHQYNFEVVFDKSQLKITQLCNCEVEYE